MTSLIPDPELPGWLRSAVASLIALSLFACKGPCDPSNSPTAELGYGWQDFSPAEPGQEVELVYGQQGGFHIDLAVATTGMDSSDLVSGSLSGTMGGTQIAEGQPWMDLVCHEEAGNQQAYGLRLIFFDIIPPDVDGQEIEVEAVLRDARGTQAIATQTFTVIDPI